jgi:TonB family protein
MKWPLGLAALLLISCSKERGSDEEVVDTTLNDAAPISAGREQELNAVETSNSAASDIAQPRLPRRAVRNDEADAESDEGLSEIDGYNASSRAASALGDLRYLFSADDYPAAAQSAGAEGTSQAILTVGPDGRVIACNLARSTGNSSLDSATCNILRRRARFTPARDSSGNPTTDTVTTPPIVWRLEG